jgi:peptidoglycan/LPS O-acetylase OafA/YrhL
MQTSSTLVEGAGEGVSGSEATATTYRPYLDGLRAVAVYLVVLFHAGSGQFSGGYVGVDVFFVLSGFLVTQLLLRDIMGNGRIRLGRFYSRRFRRLLPAAFVVLIVSAAVYTAIASPAEQIDAIGSFKAAFLYSTNWYFVHQATAYFGANIASNPVLHFWSLAVEEQFYLVWPLTLAGAFAFTRRMDRARQLRVIGIVVAVGALASALFALSLRNSDPNRAYYGTDTRAYELLAGALVALVPAIAAYARRHRGAVRVATIASVAVLGVLASSWIDLDAIERGIAVTITTVVLIVALEAADGGVVTRLLSTRSMVYLGKISYGTYLWHWLVILVLVKAFHPSTIATIGITFLVATGLASFSFDLMEHPVRTSPRLDRYRRAVIALGLTVSVVSALVLVPAILEDPHAGAVGVAGGPTSGVAPVPPGLDWRAVKRENRKAPNCFARPVDRCIVVHGTGKTIALIGDSHAQMLMAPMIEIANAENWTLAVLVSNACPWQDGLWRFSPADRRACLARKADQKNRIIPRLDPDIVVLINAPLDREGLKGQHLGGPNGPLATGSPAAERAIEAASDKTVARYQADGRDVVIIEPIPQAPQGYDPLACLSTARYLDECRFVVSRSPSPTELYYRRLARSSDHVWDLDLDRLACPYLPICDPMVRGKIVWYDLSHLSIGYARTLAEPIRALFTADAIGSA